MESIESIAANLENKSILITGSTGFLGKLIVEKVLRVQPNVKKLFLLVRAADAATAERRLETEILQTDLIQVLREKYGESFESLFWSKVTAVPGDVASEGLGINDEDRTGIWRDTDIVINSAAATNFNERYDVALKINTFGVKNILAFCMRIQKLEILIHVSTAYVTIKRNGIILERPLVFEEGYESLSTVNIDMEANLVENKLQQLEKASPEVVKASMKEMGLERANLYGSSNVYSFTKAMGEVLFWHLRKEIPVVILRPSIVTSTFLEPFPGWIEGVRTMDIFIDGYSRGQINCFPASDSAVLDIVPGDMVVNALLAILAAHSGQMFSVYQVGSSKMNPFKIGLLVEVSERYFLEKPCIAEDGKQTNCNRFFLLSKGTFYLYMFLCYKIPSMVLWLINCIFFQSLWKQYNRINSKYHRAFRILNAYQPYTSFAGSFDDYNLHKLRSRMSEEDKELFQFDTKRIDWKKYMMKAHIPGVLTYGMKIKKL